MRQYEILSSLLFLFPFSQAWDLAKHMKNNHTEDPLDLNYKCQLCDFQVDSKFLLTRHVNKAHKYRCDFCGKGFNTSGHLKRHVDNIHKQIKFNCTDCGKTFNQEDHLRTHTKNFHRKLQGHKVEIEEPEEINVKVEQYELDQNLDENVEVLPIL